MLKTKTKTQHCQLFGRKPGLTQNTDNRPTEPQTHRMPSAVLGCYRRLLSHSKTGNCQGGGEHLHFGISWVNFQTWRSMSVDCWHWTHETLEVKQTHIKHGCQSPNNTPMISWTSKLCPWKMSPTVMKGLCHFCGVKVIRGFACTSGTDTNPPNRPPPQQQELRFQKRAFCLALRPRFCGFRLVLASRAGKSFLLLSEQIPAFTAQPCGPLSADHVGSFKVSEMWLFVLSTAPCLYKVRTTADSDHSSSLSAPTTSQQCRPFSGECSAFSHHLPTPIDTKWYQASLLISSEQTKHCVPVIASQRKCIFCEIGLPAD